MKTKTYYLIDNENYVLAKFVFDQIDYFSGTCYQCVSWECNEHNTPAEWYFHSKVSSKFDGCSHWGFYGEDYDSAKDEIDGYYHLCGNYSFNNHIRLMCFVWKLAMDYYLAREERKGYKENISYVTEEYQTELINIMLDGYKIIEKEND